MPDPKRLKIGDLVKFVALPDEWQAPNYHVHEESVEFMKVMIARRWPSRVCEIDDWGNPWISARIREEGEIRLHSWAIVEKTGWRLVRRRT